MVASCYSALSHSLCLLKGWWLIRSLSDEMNLIEGFYVFIRNPNNSFNPLTQIHVWGRVEETLLMPLVYFSAWFFPSTSLVIIMWGRRGGRAFLGPFLFHSNHEIISGWQLQALIFCSCQRTVVTHGTITYVLYDFERLAASFEQREQSNSNHCFKKCGWWKFTSAFLFYTIKTEWCVLSCVPRHGFLRLLQQTKGMKMQNVWMWIVRIKILRSDRDRNLRPKYRKKTKTVLTGFSEGFIYTPFLQSREKKKSFSF